MCLHGRAGDEWHRIFSFSKPYLVKHFIQFCGLVVILTAGSVIANLSPYIWGEIVDSVSIGNVWDVVRWLIIYCFVSYATLGVSFVESHIGAKLNYIVESEIKEELMAKALHLKCEALDQFDTGTLISRVTSDTGQIITFVFNVITSAISIIVNIFSALYFIFGISLQLSLVSLIFFPLSILSNIILRKAFRVLSQRQRQYGDNFSSFTVGTFSHIPEIKGYRMEGQRVAKYHEILRDGWMLQRDQLFLSQKANLISSIISTGSIFATFVLSTYLISKSALTLGGMTSFQRYIDRLNSSISTILQMNYSAQSAVVAVERISQLMCMESEYLDGAEPDNTLSISSIEFQNVTFSYNNRPNILEDISFSIKGPGIYAIVGENGSGKSTLLKLMMRYYVETSGSILFDGVSIDSIPIGTLRESIGYFPKDVYIADDNFAANILMGCNRTNLGNNYDCIQEVCINAGLSDLIKVLPEGLDTRIGENGKLLSSGQKQKIALARAMMCNASIILFDEITSDLDGESEKNAVSVLRQLGKEKIVILVTHRLQSVQSAQKIIVLESNKISAIGCHEDLVLTCKKYRELFEKNEPSRLL